ncbi:MAG: AMP-binding protein [Rhodobacteraceae bacterium]|nr:AMP-binding protein [Paracoccaceae bacterium]
MKSDANTPPAGTLRDWIDFQAEKRGGQISHVFPGENQQATWSDMRNAARSIAEHLAGLGVEKGESVGLCLPNGKMGITCLLGVLYGGYRATTLNLIAGASALGFALSHSAARFVFVAADKADVLDEAQATSDSAATPIIVDQNIRWPNGGQTGPLADVGAGDDALLMYTSGTTGQPKGVVHSQSSILAGGWTTALAHELSADDRAYCVLPFFHINGLCVTLIGPLVSGGSVIVAERFSNSRFWLDCENHEATWFSVVPTVISHLLHSESVPSGAVKARLRFGRSASAPLAPDVQSAFENRFDVPIIETMGLTEAAAQILSNPLPPGVRKIGSPGVAVGNEVEIRRPDGVDCAAKETGEIAVRGPNVMQRYLNNPEETARVLTKDGWLLTGDLGHRDEDGYVFVTGRLKELIIKGGENIAPREVDEALYSVADVVEACAFAQACDTYGQRVEAAVVLRNGSKVTEEELIAACHNLIGTFKSPDRVHFMAELPKGPSGKIQRRILAEKL